MLALGNLAIYMHIFMVVQSLSNESLGGVTHQIICIYISHIAPSLSASAAYRSMA